MFGPLNTKNILIILLRFIEKPSITGHPQGATVTEGENITLSCDATGSPVLKISWTRNGYPIDTNGNSRITFLEDKKQLTIINVSRTDSGEYRCVAKNKVGNDTSKGATVNVQCKYSTVGRTKLFVLSHQS